MHGTISGNLTSDPELRFTPSGAAVANFSVAENRRRLNRQTNEWEDAGTSFYRCSAWREMAENVAESLTRGMRVILTGEITQEEFTRRDGSTGLAVTINVSDIGPSIKYATAKVTRNQRDPQGQPQQRPAPDPWATAAPPAGNRGQGGQSPPWGQPPDEPPF